MSTSKHTWRFFRAGGSDQVAIETAEDLRNLRSLDQTLWVALACPVKGLEFDERTLTLIDRDGDGRVRAPEVLEAVEWACRMLKDPAVLLRGGDLALDAINDADEDGARLLASAREILTHLEKSGAATISVHDTMQTATVFAHTSFNGDGVVPVEVAAAGEDREVAEAIVAALGAATDRNGKPGFTQASLDAFFDECAAYAAWWAKAEQRASELLPLGDRTGAALAALRAVRPKIDDYFGRCRLAAFDARATAALNRQETEYLTIAAQDMHITAEEVAAFPLARIEAGRSLPLAEGLNPAWAAAVATFREAVVRPILGERTTLSEQDWASLGATFAAHEAWTVEKQGAQAESLGITRVRAILAGGSKARLSALVAQDLALAPAMDAIDNVERLARYHRDLANLLHNFVAFRDFYSRERPAVFQAGSLLLDGRRAELCVRVDDAGKHAALAGLAKCYLAYCDCTRTGGEKMTIAAAFTGGDSDNLMVGRNGVFYDRKGRDWDATITKVVENPISIQQAFWAPYKKLVRLIEEQVAKRAAAGQAASDAKVSAVATTAATLDTHKPPTEPAKKIDVGTVAALGVAVGAIGAFLTTVIGYLTGVFTLPFWQVCLVFAGILFAISLPSMAIAWLKLRQRNLGPILDANGWAVNGRVKMNVPFGGALTYVARIPATAQSSFVVKYPEPPTALPKFITAAIAVAFLLSLLNHFGVIHRLTRGVLGSERATQSISTRAPSGSPATATVVRAGYGAVRRVA
jgi:hypothetical protein